MFAFHSAGSLTRNSPIMRRLSLALLCLAVGIAGVVVCASIFSPLSSETAAISVFRWMIAVLSALLAIGGGFYLMQVVRPLVQMIDFIAHLSAEDRAGPMEDDASSRDDLGQMQNALIAFKDKQLERVEREKERLSVTLAYMPQGLSMFDGNERLLVSNAGFAQVYGLSPEDIRPGMRLSEILAMRLAAGSYHGDPATYLSRRNSTGRGSKSFETVLSLANGRMIRVARGPLKEGGWVSTHEDITERCRAQEQIQRMARHDPLTDLPNRSFLMESITEGLKRVRAGEAMAVLYLDLDRFKPVNDTLGHPIGDLLLQEVAERIRGCIAETDIAARFGGDEFAIIQHGSAQPQAATVLASNLVEALGQPYTIQGHQIVIGCSVGVAVAPADGEEAEDLLKKADLALYRAKLEGRGTYRFFEQDMDARAQSRRLLELDLRGALANGEFELHYQPLVNVAADRISGVEALLRWAHPRRGPISPADFIPLAEETGLIVPIGEWVIRQACADASNWPDDIRIAVNISPVQIRSASLVSVIVAALAASGLPASRLELEITETVFLDNTEATLAILHRLRSLGVRVSMDDFGTGYSSLSYLRSFPFDKIKIDQSFVRDMTTNKQSLAIIHAVTSLGTALGMATTAEGVETKDQLEQLRIEGCTEAQGYYFSKPKPVAEINRMLSPRDGESPIASPAAPPESPATREIAAKSKEAGPWPRLLAPPRSRSGNAHR